MRRPLVFVLALMLATPALLACGGSSSSPPPFVPARIYAADGKSGIPGNLYAIDPATAAATIIGPIGFAITGLAYNPADGMLYGTEATEYQNTNPESRLIRINPATGVGTVVGPLTDSVDPMTNHGACPDLTFLGSRLLGWTEDSDQPMEVNMATGVVTVIGGGTGSFGSGMATSPGGTVYVAPDSTTGDIWSVDPLTGVVTSVATLMGPAVNDAVNSMTYADGTLFGVASDDDGSGLSLTELYRIDLATGMMTLVGPLPGGIDAIASTRN